MNQKEKDKLKQKILDKVRKTNIRMSKEMWVTIFTPINESIDEM